MIAKSIFYSCLGCNVKKIGSEINNIQLLEYLVENDGEYPIICNFDCGDSEIVTSAKADHRRPFIYPIVTGRS